MTVSEAQRRAPSFLSPQATQEMETSETATREDGQPLTASSRLVIGEIVWVDEDASIAVGWLASRFAAVDEHLITRNFELEQTSTLRPTPWRQGRSLGLEILSGHPQTGDEIVVDALPGEEDSP